jgi:predicted  nucleic acid-binding Zn ribbon protein
MYYAKISFKPIKKIEDTDVAEECFWRYFPSLYGGGQIYKEYEVVKTNKGYEVFFTMPEKDSLNEKYTNHYAREGLQKLQELFEVGELEIIGENISSSEVCECSNPSWYKLCTVDYVQGSPIICGECDKGIPLYKTPKIPVRCVISGDVIEDEYHQIQCWQKNYQCIDKLWFLSLMDRYTYRQMNNPQSQLSELGLWIRRELEKAYGKPVYYFITCFSITGRGKRVQYAERIGRYPKKLPMWHSNVTSAVWCRVRHYVKLVRS